MATPRYILFSVQDESRENLTAILKKLRKKPPFEIERDTIEGEEWGIIFTEDLNALLESPTTFDRNHVIVLARDHQAGIRALEQGANDYIIVSELKADLLEKALTIAENSLKSEVKNHIGSKEGSQHLDSGVESDIFELVDGIEGVLSRHREYPDGRIENIFISQGVERLWGIPRDEVRRDPSNIWRRLDPDIREGLQKAFYGALEKGEKLDYIYKIDTKEVGEKWLHVIAIASKLPDGSIVWDSITSDISELKRAEKSAEEQRKFLDNIIKNIDGVVQRYRIKPDGSDETLFLSDGFETITGIPVNEAIKDQELLWSQILEEDREKLKKSIARATDNLSPWRHTWRIIDRQGRLKWVRGSGMPVVQKDGSVIFDSVVTDITELASTGEELSSFRGKFELAANAAQLGLWEYDVVENKLVWDDLMFKIFGVDRKNFKGSAEDWQETLHPEDKRKATSELQKTIELGMDFESQFRIIRPDNGEMRHIRATAKSMKNEKGQVVSMVGLNWDITYLVKIQEKLTETYKRYELASKATQDAVWDWDLSKNTIIWNDAFTGLFGHEVDPEGDPFNNWERHVHPDDRERVMKGLTDQLKGKTNQWEARYRFRKGNGEYAYVFDRGFLVRDYNGEAVRMVGSMKDETRTMEFIATLQKQNESLKQIAWTQSHELRGPLSGILGLVNVARSDYERSLSKDEFLDRLEKASLELDEIIHRIVRLSEKVGLEADRVKQE